MADDYEDAPTGDQATGRSEKDESTQARCEPGPEGGPTRPRRAVGRVADEGSDRARGKEDGGGPARREAGDLPGVGRTAEGLGGTVPRGASKTHLFAAQQGDRYARQAVIRQYEETFGCRLIVMIDQIFSHGITYMEELLQDADPEQPLHLLLSSPGGDGEIAIRLIRSIRARCSQFTIIVPDMAKSAATLMCLGADELLMGPASDLGPIDPQFPIGDNLYGASELEQALQDAESRVAALPNTYPLYSGLLADVNMLMIEQARSEMARSHDLIREALDCRGFDSTEQEALLTTLAGPLVDNSRVHRSTIGPKFAANLGLPVTLLDTRSNQWQMIWALWTRYFHAGCFPAGSNGIYEGRYASQALY